MAVTLSVGFKNNDYPAYFSDARETWQVGISGRGHEDSAADQVANQWGREGKDPNHFRPPNLPSKY